MTSSNNVLHPEDAHELETTGLLSASINGKRKISSSTILSTLSSSSGATSNSGYSDSHSFEVEIPDSLKSKETYVFLGLRIETAEMLWRRWSEVDEDAREPDGPVGFLDIATQHIRNQDNNVDDEGKDWNAVLSGWGVDDDLREVILDPEFDDLRYTASAAFWVVDTFEMRYRGLEAISESSRKRQRKMQELRKCEVRKAGGQFEPSTETLGMRDGGREETPEPLYHEAFPAHTPGTTRVYRGGDMESLKKVFNPLTGKSNLLAIQSMWPIDFRGLVAGPTLYFGLEEQVGRRCARYAKNRSGVSIVAVIYMDVKNSFIDYWKPYVLRGGDEWKQIVYESRRRNRYPDHLSHLQNHPLFIGYIFRTHHSPIEKLDSWTELTDHNIMKIEEEIFNKDSGTRETAAVKATQYVFNGQAIITALEKEVDVGYIKEKPKLQT